MLRKLLLTTAALVGISAMAHADEVEVLHWWTSGGEAAALEVLKKDLESKGVTWKDMPVAGGGGEAAMTALRARVTAGNPPTAVQALGFDIPMMGFGEDELAALLADKASGWTDPDEVPEAPAEPVSVLGDVWLLGRHRIPAHRRSHVAAAAAAREEQKRLA